MDKDIDYLDDDILDDIGELKELDFGNRKGKSEENIDKEEVQKKIEFVDENLWGKLQKSGKRISFAKDILALYSYMKDPSVKWYRKAIIVAALIYFIVPIDTIPDLTPLFGYLDDLGVLTALLKYLGDELTVYYAQGFVPDLGSNLRCLTYFLSPLTHSNKFKMNYRILKSKVIFRGKVFNTKVDQIEYSSGNKAVREVAEHPGGAVIVPITDDGKIVMVTQHRYPMNKSLLELPAGKLNKDEDPYVCAVRELEEETGYKSDSVTELGSIYTTPGYSTEKLWIYLAKNLKPGNHNREEGEYGMEVFELSPKEIDEKIINGEIVDGKTICGFYLVKKYI